MTTRKEQKLYRENWQLGMHDPASVCRWGRCDREWKHEQPGKRPHPMTASTGVANGRTGVLSNRTTGVPGVRSCGDGIFLRLVILERQ